MTLDDTTQFVLLCSVPSYTWQLADTPHPDWPHWVEACGGGVFHTPAGVLVGAPEGEVVYVHLVAGGETRGIAVGVRSRCRLSWRVRHAHFPALPALAPGIDVGDALEALRDVLRKAGIAEVEIGSYDASYVPADGIEPRLEYVVSFPQTGDVTSAWGTTHRRHVRRGDRDGWTTRLLLGDEARTAILGIQQSTAERAASLHRGFAPAQVTGWVSLVTATLPLPDWGLAVVGAYRDTTLLAALLLGWAGQRAFYLIGGSTPDGYQCGAAPWLHAQAMTMLARRGIQRYNLGGTPLDAAEESSPAHGLYRFKTGFGVSPVERRGMRWLLRPGHAQLHQMLSRFRRPG